MFYDTFGFNPYTVYVLTLTTALVLFCHWLHSTWQVHRVFLCGIGAIATVFIALHMPSEENPGSTEFWGMIGGSALFVLYFIIARLVQLYPNASR